MGKILYIHIGMPKTGTSSIQNFFLTNKELLEQQGVFYPNPWPGHAGHPFIEEGAHTTWGASSDAETIFEKLLHEISQTQAKTVFVSSESFVFVDPIQLDRLFSLFESNYVIVYLRNFFSYSQSFLQEIAKAPYVDCLEDIYEKLFLPDTLRTWLHYFGDDNCIIKNFDAISKTSFLIEDLLHTIGIDDFTDLFFPLRENVGLKSPYIFFLRHLASLPFDRQFWSFLVYEISILSCADTNAPTYALIPQAVLKKLHNRIQKQVEWEAELLNDTAWPEYCWKQSTKLGFCPYTQLPPVDQHRIFDALSEYLQQLIVTAYTPARLAKESVSLLPPIYYDEELYKIFFRWQRVFFEYQVQVDHASKEKEMPYQKTSVQLVKHLLTVAPTLPLYDLSESHDIVICQDIENIKYKNGVLYIVSVGIDPICFLPTIELQPHTPCVVHVCGTGPSSRWQLFYTTKEHPEYSEDRALCFDPHPTEEQKEGALLLLPSNALGSNLRLDVGDAAGEYCIEILKIYVISI